MTKTALQSAQEKTDRNRQKQLGKALMRLYSDALAEPVPEELLRLLGEADMKRKPPPD